MNCVGFIASNGEMIVDEEFGEMWKKKFGDNYETGHAVT
jgi:hypothetical protein